MINQNDSKIWFKFNGLLRSFIAHGGLLNLADIYIVNEYPKSGGTWLSQMLSKALEVPFPRNRLPIMGASLLHGHFRNKWNMKRLVILWRDGRDVIVSQYHHVVHLSGKSKGYKGQMSRDLNFSDRDDIAKNLPKFIEYMFTSSNHKHLAWPEFVDYWYGTQNAVETKYELLHVNTVHELERILRHLTGKDYDLDKLNGIVEQYSFQNQSSRKPGEERKNNFLRKGIVGDWQNYFNQESSEIFDNYAGNQLIKLGYEKDHNWLIP